MEIGTLCCLSLFISYKELWLCELNKKGEAVENCS